MIARNRIAKIEGNLTPQQVVLNWIADKMRRFSSFEELGLWGIEQPGSEAPLNKMAKAAREAVCAAMKGQPKDAINDAEWQAVREAHFLVRLFINANEMLLRNTVPFRLEAEKCILKLRLRFTQLVICQDVRETLLLLRIDPKGARALENLPKRITQRLDAYLLEGEEFWPRQEADVGVAAEVPDDQAERSWFSELTDIDGLREEIIDYAIKAYLVHDVIEALRRTYFAGQAVLFREDANRLEEAVKEAEKLASLHDGMVWCYASIPKRDDGHGENGPWDDEPPPERLIDLEATKANVTADVRRNVAFDVCMAKAETLIGLGDNEDGYRLAKEAFHKHYGPKKPQ